MILSAKYGLLAPNDIIPSDYNVSFCDPKSNPITSSQLRKQVEAKRLLEFDCIIVLGGKCYVNILKGVLPGEKLTDPLEGSKGNGDMMSLLLKAIDNNVPLTGC
jgi:hypothetical protein